MDNKPNRIEEISKSTQATENPDQQINTVKTYDYNQTSTNDGQTVSPFTITLDDKSPDTMDLLFKDTGDNRLPRVPNFIPATQTKVVALLDSGANISCIDRSFVEGLGLFDKLIALESDYIPTKGAGSHTLEEIGYINLSYIFGPVFGTSCLVVINNLSESVIFGMDWIRQYNLVLRFEKNKRVHSRSKLYSVSTIVIPPRSEKTALVQTAQRQRYFDGALGTVQSRQKWTSKGVLTPNAICESRDGHVPMRFFNANDKSIVIKRGTHVGGFQLLSPNESIMSVTKVERDLKSGHPSTDLPPEPENTEVPDEWRKKFDDLIDEFSAIFPKDTTKIGCARVPPHRIYLKPGVERIYTKQYPIPQAYQKAVNKQLEELYEQDVIEPSNSSFNSPVLGIGKKDGSVRVVVDLRGLNRSVIVEDCSLPDINTYMATVGNSKPRFFSSLDLNKSFFQLELDEASRPYTAFQGKEGKMQFKRLPMGYINSSSVFQTAVDYLFRAIDKSYALCLLMTC